MDQLDHLIQHLAIQKIVAFSFLGRDDSSLAVSIRECEDYDFDEYGEEYVQGGMFEVGPARPAHKVISTQLVFANIYEAGNAVLRRRAALLGESWGDT